MTKTMNIKLKYLKNIIFILVLLTTLISCSSSNALTDHVQKKSSIVVRIPNSYANIVLPEGDVGDNTFMTRYIEKKLGYEVQYTWESSGEEQYSATLDLAIKSKDIPDVFVVNREQLKELIEQDLIADLSDVYEQYASELVKSIYDATNGQALKEATFSDTLYGLPNVAILADGPTYIWIREDWLKQLKLTPPKTVYDVERIVESFIKDDPDQNGIDDTIGIPVDRSLIYTKKTGTYGLNSIFAAFDAFPQHYYVNNEGNLVYGSIQSETKEALALLQDWYEKGIIDQQFVLRKDPNLSVQQNKVGLIFAPWWAPYWPLDSSVALDTKADWVVYQAPFNSEGQFKTLTSPITDRYLVVRKDYEHPEAAMELLNLLTTLERMVGEDDEETTNLRVTSAQLGVQMRNYFPFDLLLDDPNGVINRYEQIQMLLNKELPEENLTPEVEQLYKQILQEYENPRKDLEAWRAAHAYLQGGKVSTLPKTMVKTYNLENIASFDTNSESLLQLEMDYFIGIITGELPIDAFDEFVEQWLTQGGITILKEINGLVVDPY